MPGWYTSRVNASVAAAPAAQAPLGLGQLASALGRTAGAIADQTSQVDEKVKEIDFAIAEREKARVRDAASAKASVALAQGEGEYNRWVIDNQNDAQFESKANARVDADIAAVKGLLGDDPELNDLYAPLLTRTGETRKTAAFSHVAAIRAKASGDALDASATAWGNVVGDHPERTEEAVGVVTVAITGNSSIPEALKPGLVHQVTGGLWLKGLEANVIAGKYEAVDQALNDGSYDAVLPEGGKAGLQRMIGAQRQLKAQADEQAAADEKRLAADGLKTIRIAIDHGEAVPVGTINAAIARGQQAGVEGSVLVDAAYLGEDMVFDGKIRGLDDAALTAQVDALRAKRSAGKLNGKEARILDRGEKALNDRTTKQADVLGALWKTGPEGERSVVSQLHGMTPEQRFAAAEQMHDPKLAITAALPPANQAVALEGRRLRAADKDAFLPLGTTGKPDSAAMEAEFNRIVPLSVRSHLGPNAVQLREAAMDYFAGSQARAGGGGKWSAAGFGQAVNAVFGTRRRASDGKFAGGLGVVRGRTVELPDGVTADEFDQRLSRYDFAGGGALYADGKPARNADVLAHYQPVPDHEDPKTHETAYRFETASGDPLRWGNGLIWTVPFAQGPR